MEIKCPETKFEVTPLDACSDPAFYLEDMDGVPTLKKSHGYYDQVQGQLGITKAKWCDFVVYTDKELSIERLTLNEIHWTELKQRLTHFYFEYFLPEAAKEFASRLSLR